MQKNWIGKSFDVKSILKLKEICQLMKLNVLLGPILCMVSLFLLFLLITLYLNILMIKDFLEFKKQCSKTGTTEESIALGKNWLQNKFVCY